MKGGPDKSFVPDMFIPDCKLVNTIAFPKYVNMIRAANMNTSKNSIKDVSEFVADIKSSSQRTMRPRVPSAEKSEPFTSHLKSKALKRRSLESIQTCK